MIQENHYNKCNKNFISEYAYINNVHIHIDNYIKNEEKYKNEKIKCQNNHELILVNGSIRKKHFRHKNSCDLNYSPISNWHLNWQAHFPETEILFKKKNDKQIKDRRADILIRENNIVIEIQHSNIDDANVICRYDDYKLHNIDIIWIIDGNTEDIELEELSTGNFLVIFNENWKYKSFKHNYDFILLDIKNKIFKIPVKNVCNKMILLKEYKTTDEVVNILKNNPNNLWNMWDDDNEIKATLTIKQQGAGNGKTFGIWKSISNNKDKNTFIILTKQHTAKEVIKKELNDQCERNEFHIIDNMKEVNDEIYGKQIIVNYKHKYSERICKVIIGTIDSFIYNLINCSKTNADFFESMLNNIVEYGCNKVNSSTGEMKYAGTSCKLNKKVELWIDESQDLNTKYSSAIIKLMLSTKIDVVIVGDKLQSLEYENNFITNVENDNIPNINIIKEIPKNENRRIQVKNMKEEINSLINFNKYNLPNISIPPDAELKYNNTIFELIDTPKIYAGDPDKNKVEKYINDILDIVVKEVDENNYSPENFMFIFPIMKNNILAIELETKLNEYWINKIDDNSNYKQYAILHKHQEGQVIDTTLSEKATRIMSIKSSKGDGREIVFVLQCTEQSLKICSNNKKNLIYESHLHVALTRAKHKIYFGLVKNNDDIHERFGDLGYTEYIPDIKLRFNTDTIIQKLNKNNIIQILKNNNISDMSENEDKKKFNNTKIIDWNYYCIRRTIYLQYAIFSIINKNKNNSNFNTSQIKIVLKKISKLPIKKCSPNKYYETLRDYQNKDLLFFPLCNLSNKDIYKNLYYKIYKTIEKLQNNNFSLDDQSPLESVLQQYLIEVYRRKNYSDTTPSTIYNIFHYYEDEDNNKIIELLDDSTKIRKITEVVFDDIFKNKNIQWNIEHVIKLKGNTKDLSISYTNIPIIGYDEEYIYHLKYITDYNKLNYWDILIEILIERFVIYNPLGNNIDSLIDNIDRFKNKKIKTILFILKKNTYELFDWDWDNKLETELKEEFKNAIIKDLSQSNKQIFQYYDYIKNHKDKWESFKNPLEYISNIFNNVNYIRCFFDELNQKCLNGKKDEVILLTQNENDFCKCLDYRIEQMCDTFFGLNIIDIDEEW